MIQHLIPIALVVLLIGSGTVPAARVNADDSRHSEQGVITDLDPLERKEIYLGPEIFLFPNPAAGVEELFNNEPAWAEARRRIRVWIAPLFWIGSPEKTSDQFLRDVFLPALKRWNIALSVEATQGAGWVPENQTDFKSEDVIEKERAWWDRLERLLGEDYTIDYIRLDSPNSSGMQPPPIGAGLSLNKTLKENGKYISHIKRRFPDAKIVVSDDFFGWGGRKNFVSDVQAWLAAAMSADFAVDIVDFKIPLDPSRNTNATGITLAQKWLRSQSIQTGTSFVSEMLPESYGYPFDRKWYERIMYVLSRQYSRSDFMPDTLSVGFGPGRNLISRRRLLKLTNLLENVPSLLDVPSVQLDRAPLIQLPGKQKPSKESQDADSNSPLHWDGETLYAFTSAGQPYRSSGANLTSLNSPAQPVTFNNARDFNGRRWLEATYRDHDGTLYGWYHNEPTDICRTIGRSDITAPRVGALVSYDNGEFWHDLGIVLEMPEASLRCDTRNKYFAGGIGDFSVILDDKSEYFYFFVSTYSENRAEQGVSVARMRYQDRNDPAGTAWKWHNRTWNQPGLGGLVTPIFKASINWHRDNADAFWGPAVHYNTHLNMYVILLNRTADSSWSQEGIYLSFNQDLANPPGWSTPKKVLDVRDWYPQVVGTGKGETDKLSGRAARLFIKGSSIWEITFLRPDEQDKRTYANQ